MVNIELKLYEIAILTSIFSIIYFVITISLLSMIVDVNILTSQKWVLLLLLVFGIPSVLAYLTIKILLECLDEICKKI